jgi:hypothetical protein
VQSTTIIPPIPSSESILMSSSIDLFCNNVLLFPRL